ncbi:hypothetical protein ACH5RR_011780 [Cinchona calisaya]|uniref:J domain-containing protein n=1 Tax=Cinchona calisaya TaxID=153742 RepID=A0ABD3A5Z8_9GENT
MENLSHSFLKKSYAGNGGFGTASHHHKSVYDDVFGGPPKFGMPTLAPRLEDYTEIFGGFHSARGCSIPILDLPVVDEAEELSFDVLSSRLDYSEVFGGFDYLDFTMSFEDLIRKSNGGDDPSFDDDDAWIPTQSDYLSDESDPSAYSERSESLTNKHTQRALSGTRQFDVSDHKASPGSNEKMSNVAIHVAQFHAIPGHAYMIDENHASQKVDGPKLQASSDLKSDMDFGGRTMEEKQFIKSTSLPEKFDLAMHENDFYHVEKSSGSVLSHNESFVTINDINLRTKPSCLPPPSRPPPVFSVKKGASEKTNPKLKASGSNGFDQTGDDSSPPFYDVEIDGSSSMMASAAMRDAMKKAQAKIRSAQESIEKKEVSRSRSKLQPQNDIEIVEEKISKAFDSINNCKDDRLQGKYAKEDIQMRPLAEERNKGVKLNQEVADLVEGESYIDLAGKPTMRRNAKESRLSYNVPHKSEGTFAWRQATEYFEVVEADIPFKAVEQNKDENKLVQMGSDEYEYWIANEAFEQQESVKEFKVAKEAPKLEGKRNKVEVPIESRGHRRLETTRESCCQTDFQKKAKVGVNSCESEMNEKKMKMAKQCEENKKLQNFTEKSAQNQTGAGFHATEARSKNNPRDISEKTDTDKMFMDSHARNTNERRVGQNFEMDECHTTFNKAVEQDRNRKREMKQDEKKKQEECHEKQKEACERKEDQNTAKEVNEHEDNQKQLKGSIEYEENEKDFRKSFEKAENERGQEQDCQIEKDKGTHTEAYKLVENEKNFEVTLSQDHENRECDACEAGKSEVRLKSGGKLECNKNESTLTFVEEDFEESSKVSSTSEKSSHVIKEVGKHEELSGHAKDAEQIMRDGNVGTVKLDQVTHSSTERENVKAFGGTGKPTDEIHEEFGRHAKDAEQIMRDGNVVIVKLDKVTHLPMEREDVKMLGGMGKVTDEVYSTLLPGKLNKNFQKLETTQVPISHGGDEKFKTNAKDSVQGLDVEAANLLVEEISHSFEKNENELQHEIHENGTLDVTNSPCLDEYWINSNDAGIGNENSLQDMEISQRAYDPETTRVKTHEQGPGVKTSNVVQITVNKDIPKSKLTSFQPCMEWADNGKVIGAALSAVLEDRESALNTAKRCSQNLERKEKIMNESLAQKNEIEERLQKERELEKEHLRKIEEEREREREREKDRMAVDRATLEARDRSFVEARERAERAAVERATAEVRQRAVAEAREKLEKASLEARERSLADKASVEAKLRAERAAVERATLEARQRAFEKAMADNVSFEARERVERSVSDMFSASSRTVDMRQSSSFSDLPDLQSQNTGTSNTLRYSYSSVHAGVEGESPQRCKARLERYRRTAERAAKALEEKNMRDLLAQREQAERSRLAETLDAEVKRWSSGKEGNLRALLSTLQYILGPGSGWQPIPLTEVITSAAVKKAYRKATLCVHPDKLQQRGASIQQKYICEKVFDLLKEAWNTFNSEEW